MSGGLRSRGAAAPRLARPGCRSEAARHLAGEVAQFAQGLEFHLAHPLPRHIQQPANLGQGVALLALQPEAQLQHLALLVGEVGEPATQLLLVDAALHLLEGSAPLVSAIRSPRKLRPSSPFTGASRLEVVRA